MFVDRIRTYQELHEKYIHELKNGAGEYILPNAQDLVDFETWVEYQPGGNKAFVLLDLKDGQYIKWHLVKEIFGYSNDEFTAEAINNFTRPPFIHEDHIDHKRRYGSIIIGLLKSEIKFKVRMDSYSIEFKLRHKQGHYIPVRRTSIIFQVASSTEILTRLDEWEILSKHHADYVYPEISMSEPEKTDKLNEMFYKKNLEILNFSDLFTLKKIPFSQQLMQVFYYKLQYPDLSNKEIALKLKLSDEHVVEKLFNRISERIRSKFGGYDLQGVQKIKSISRIYGLFPIPRVLVESKT